MMGSALGFPRKVGLLDGVGEAGRRMRLGINRFT